MKFVFWRPQLSFYDNKILQLMPQCNKCIMCLGQEPKHSDTSVECNSDNSHSMYQIHLIWGLQSSGILRSIEWYCLTDVSTQLVSPILKGQKISWPLKMGLTTLHCVTSQKSTDLTYMMAEAWIHLIFMTYGALLTQHPSFKLEFKKKQQHHKISAGTADCWLLLAKDNCNHLEEDFHRDKF